MNTQFTQTQNIYVLIIGEFIERYTYNINENKQVINRIKININENEKNININKDNIFLQYIPLVYYAESKNIYIIISPDGSISEYSLPTLKKLKKILHKTFKKIKKMKNLKSLLKKIMKIQIKIIIFYQDKNIS